MSDELRDVLISVLFGLGMIVFFMSIFGFIWLFAFGAARVRQWWESRRIDNTH